MWRSGHNVLSTVEEKEMQRPYLDYPFNMPMFERERGKRQNINIIDITDTFGLSFSCLASSYRPRTPNT